MHSHLRDQLQNDLGSAYAIERELGGGGMSRVFLAEETALGRKVVVKVLAPELAAGVSAERFAREIRTVAGLQHPNIVPVHAAGEAAGLPYYTMPFVAGSSLRAAMAEQKPLALTEAIHVLRDVARALIYAHEKGLVHRDIKPENVLLSGDAAVVTDFGIAKAVSAARLERSESLTQLGTAVGSPAYMAPEQATGDPATDHRADIYSFGCLGHEVLTGTPPFGDRSAQRLVVAHAMEQPPSVAKKRRDVPPALAALIDRCLAKDPADRPQSARELLASIDAGTSGRVERAAFVPRSRVSLLVGGAALLLLVAAGGYAVRSGTARSASGVPDAIRSLVVLPFENVGGDTANVYFADGMTDELSNALAQVPNLRLVARSSAYTFRDRRTDAREVARVLDVGAVLEGSVRRAGNRLRVNAQLTNGSDGLVLWSSSYERDTRDVFAVQDEITHAIVSALRVTLAGGPAAIAVPAQRTVDLETYDLYLRGLYFQEQRRPDAVRRSVDYFEQALARDPDFSRAHAALSTALGLYPFLGLATRDIIPRSRAVAERAVALDPGSAGARGALGRAYSLSFDWSRSNAELQRGVELDPDDVMVRLAFGNNLLAMGLADEAVEHLRIARRGDPLGPVSSALLALALDMAGQSEEALAEAARAVELDSGFALGLMTLTRVSYHAGRMDEARIAAQRASQVALGASMGTGTYYLARLGDVGRARANLRQLEAGRGAPSAFRQGAIALAHLGLGDTSRALDALEMAARGGDLLPLVAPFRDRMYDPVRQSTRFAAVLRQYNLNESRFR